MSKSLNMKNCRTDLDILKEIVSLMKPGTLTVIGGRPGAGKTEFAFSLADIMSHFDKKVMFFSLSESRECLLERFEHSNETIDRNLFIDDTNNMTVPLMKRRIQAVGGVDCVLINYLGLISPDAKGVKRSEETVQITAGLKDLSVEFDIPVVCFAQLSRDRDGNPELPESEAIAADTENVITIEQDGSKNTHQV